MTTTRRRILVDNPRGFTASRHGGVARLDLVGGRRPPPRLSFDVVSTTPDRASRHGRVLRVGRAAALSGARGHAGGHRRRQPSSTGRDDRSGHGQVTRRFARLRDYVGRGVATTATYAARALGVNSAMGLMKAARLAPDAILLPTDFDAYRRYSRVFKAAVRAIAPASRGPRHRRNLHRPHRASSCRSTMAPPMIRRKRGGARATSRGRSRRACARRPGCRARSRSHPTSCWPRSPPSSTSPMA